MDLVDPDYKFMYIDRGDFGNMSDSQIFKNSELKECILNGTIGWPQPAKLLKNDRVILSFILGGDIFARCTYLI